MNDRQGGRIPSALWLMVRRSLRHHALTTWVTILSCALASGLAMAVWSLEGQTTTAFRGGSAGFDAVLGARGSPLQLVLCAVFHLETSPGNLPWSLYKSMESDPRIRLAVPLAVGDNYQGFRIAGTTPEFFLNASQRGASDLGVPAPGRIFDPAAKEVVLGSLAARSTRLAVGDRFHPAHGVSAAEGRAHEEEYLVVGVLHPTGTPIDRVIWAPIESVFHMEGHVLRGSGVSYEPRAGEVISEEHKEVSAVLLRLRSPQAGFSLDEEFNRRRKDATFAWPISRVVADFFDRLGWISRILNLVAVLVMFVSAGSILTGIYNSMEARGRDLAILRTLGAGRKVIFSAVILEGGAIGAIGGLLGCGFAWAIIALVTMFLRARTGVQLEIFRANSVFLIVPLGMFVLGSLAGLLPAAKAYATDVAGTLGDAP